MNNFRAYRFLNRKNETMKVVANWVALALTFIKGEQVQDWANGIMDLMEEQLESRLNPMEETNEYHWTSFKDAFRDTFTNTLEWEDTDNQLQNLKMTDGDLDKFIAHFNHLVIISGREDETRGLVPLFKEGLPFGLAQACMNQEHWPQTICQWQEAARDEHKWYQVKKNLGLARTPKTRKDKKQLWKTTLKREEARRQLSPHGGRHDTDPKTTLHRTSEKTDGRGTMLPL